MRRLFLPLTLAFSLAVSSLAFASEAESFLMGKHGELVAAVKQNNTKKLDKLFDEVLDYHGLAVASLGEEWGKRTPEEQQAFEKLLTQLVRNSYRSNLKKTANYDVSYSGE